MEKKIKTYLGVKTDLFGYNGDIGTIDRFYPSYGKTGQFKIIYKHDMYISWVNKERVIAAIPAP